MTACTLKAGDADTDASASSTGESGTGGASETSAGDPTGPTPTGSEGGSAPTEASGSGPGDTGSDDGSATDPGTDSGDTEMPPLPVECTEEVAEVAAAFDFGAEWFATDGDGFTPCTVEAVGVEGAMSVTGLNCGPSVTLRIAVAPEGPPSWGPGDAVQLRTSFIGEPGFDDEWRRFELRSADDELLAVGIDRDTLKPEWTAPIVLNFAFSCGPEGDDLGPPVRMEIDFSLADATLGLLPGHRGALAIDGTDSFAIDVQRASANECCDYETGRWQHLLIRRVTLE